jgi:hypothetical protein
MSNDPCKLFATKFLEACTYSSGMGCVSEPLVSTNDGESGFREPSRRLKESQNGFLPFISFAYMPYRGFVKLGYGSFAGVTGSTGDPRYYANHIGEKHL